MKTNHGGALLFAVITAFVLTLIVSTLVIFTTTQYQIINSEINRTRASYRNQAGMEYAIYNLYSGTAGWTPPPGGAINQSINIAGVPVNINIVPDMSGTSSYQISITTNY